MALQMKLQDIQLISPISKSKKFLNRLLGIGQDKDTLHSPYGRSENSGRLFTEYLQKLLDIMAEISATLIPFSHKLYKHFTHFTEAYSIGPNEICYPKFGPQVVNRLQQFKARDDDVYVVTFPKTGTTWMQEIVYLLMNNLDFEKANSIIRETVFPYADMNVWEVPSPDHIDIMNNLPSPRSIKCHLHYSLIPPDVIKQCKMIYVCRNVKDTIISYYHFMCSLPAAQFRGTIEDFVDLFMENKVPYAPYVTHVRDFWERKNEKNIYFTTYEDLQKDQEKVVAEVAEFLNRPASNEEIKLIADHCKFDNMKKNPMANRSHLDEKTCQKEFQFMRKGTVGNWVAEMSPELIAKIDKWTYEQTIDIPPLREIL